MLNNVFNFFRPNREEHTAIEELCEAYAVLDQLTNALLTATPARVLAKDDLIKQFDLCRRLERGTSDRNKR